MHAVNIYIYVHGLYMHAWLTIVPGIGGSQLTAKVGEPMPSHCRTNGKFRNIWVNVYKSVTDSEFRKCFFEDIVYV